LNETCSDYDTCWLNENPNAYTLWTNSDGISARDACCECGGGTYYQVELVVKDMDCKEKHLLSATSEEDCRIAALGPECESNYYTIAYSSDSTTVCYCCVSCPGEYKYRALWNIYRVSYEDSFPDPSSCVPTVAPSFTPSTYIPSVSPSTAAPTISACQQFTTIKMMVTSTSQNSLSMTAITFWTRRGTAEIEVIPTDCEVLPKKTFPSNCDHLYDEYQNTSYTIENLVISHEGLSIEFTFQEGIKIYKYQLDGEVLPDKWMMTSTVNDASVLVHEPSSDKMRVLCNETDSNVIVEDNDSGEAAIVGLIAGMCVFAAMFCIFYVYSMKRQDMEEEIRNSHLEMMNLSIAGSNPHSSNQSSLSPTAGGGTRFSKIATVSSRMSGILPGLYTELDGMDSNEDFPHGADFSLPEIWREGYGGIYLNAESEVPFNSNVDRLPTMVSGPPSYSEEPSFDPDIDGDFLPEHHSQDGHYLAGVSGSQMGTQRLPTLTSPVSFSSNLESDYNTIESSELIKLEVCGEGTFGRIFKGERDGGLVALKFLDKKSKENRQALLREFTNLRKISRHPYVLDIQGYCNDPDFECLVIDFVDGPTLTKMVHRMKHGKDPWWTPLQLMNILRQASSGLTHLHKHLLIHRDIAARNIMFDKKIGSVKIIDFGMCEFVDDANAGGFSNDLFGPVRWMAPECFVHHPEGFLFSAKSDVWMFACSIFEMIEGMFPYKTIKDREVASKRSRNESMKPVCESTRWMPQLQELCELCWNFDPLKRPSMIELRDNFVTWYKLLKQQDSAVANSPSIHSING